MDRETLYKFFTGTTSYEEEVGIRQWMDASSANRDNFMKERKLFDAMTLLGREEEVKKERGERNKQPIMFTLLKIAAVVLITLSANFFYQYLTEKQGSIPMQAIYVPAGQRINITLPDGTNVWVNARTTIKYPTVFADDARGVILDGEAYFDVAKDATKPFIVETSKCKLEVLGTKFNVEAYADRDEFEAALMEGSIKVTSAMSPENPIILKPNYKAHIKGNKLEVSYVDDLNPYRWKEGLICFKNEAFSAIMDEFKKYYGIEIYIRRDAPIQYFFTGKFRQTDGVDYALRVLQQDVKFEYSRDNERGIIYID